MKKLFAVVVLCGCLSLLLSLVSCAKPKMPEFEVEVIYQDENYTPAYTYQVGYKEWHLAPFSIMGGIPYGYYVPALVAIHPDNSVSYMEGAETYFSPSLDEWRETLLAAFPDESFLDTGDNWEIFNSLVYEDEQFLLVHEYLGKFSEQELISEILFRHTESDGWIYKKYKLETPLNYGRWEKSFTRWGNTIAFCHEVWFTSDLEKTDSPIGEYHIQTKEELIDVFVQSNISAIDEFKKDMKERIFCRVLHDSNNGILYDMIIMSYPDNSDKTYIMEYTADGEILRVIYIPYFNVHSTESYRLCSPGEDGKYYDIIRTVEKESE